MASWPPLYLTSCMFVFIIQTPNGVILQEGMIGSNSPPLLIKRRIKTWGVKKKNCSNEKMKTFQNCLNCQEHLTKMICDPPKKLGLKELLVKDEGNQSCSKLPEMGIQIVK